MQKINKNNINKINLYITRKCNYNCSYCLTLNNSGHKELITDFCFSSIKKYLPGKWLIRLTGGEPFLAPRFLFFVEKLIKSDFNVGITTNFSASLSEIIKFCDITKNNLAYFRASLHLDHADKTKFLERAILINKKIGKKFSVQLVASRKYLNQIESIVELFKINGIRIFLLVEMQNSCDKKYSDYTANETRQLKKIFSKYNRNLFKANKTVSFKGRLCWAGTKYFILYESGETWSCPQLRAMRYQPGYLGNIIKGTFRPINEPILCPADFCRCINPIDENLIIQ